MVGNARNSNNINRYPTLESSAAHFNTNFIDNNYQSRNTRDFNHNSGRNKK